MKYEQKLLFYSPEMGHLLFRLVFETASPQLLSIYISI